MVAFPVESESLLELEVAQLECARDYGESHLLRTAGPKSIHNEVGKEFWVERRVLDAPKLREVELQGGGR